jgi:hypothetical protein
MGEKQTEKTNKRVKPSQNHRTYQRSKKKLKKGVGDTDVGSTERSHRRKNHRRKKNKKVVGGTDVGSTQ